MKTRSKLLCRHPPATTAEPRQHLKYRALELSSMGRRTSVPLCFLSHAGVLVRRARVGPLCAPVRQHGAAKAAGVRRVGRRGLVRAAAVAAVPEAGAVGDADEFEGERVVFEVAATEVGLRVDKVITGRVEGQSRSYFQMLMDEGNVLVDGAVTRAKARKVAAGEVVEVRFITPMRDMPMEPEDIPLQVLYEDEHIVAINKAAGMVVHPAPGNWTGTLVNALAFRYKEILALGGSRPGVVHRLDKGTSGVIVAAKSAEAHRALTEMFAEREVEKTYLAITVGNPAGEGCLAAVVNEPIGRNKVDRLRMAIVPEDAGGKAARSIVEVLQSDERRLLHIVRVGIETGRTHQIRVHLRHRRTPVLGDDLYGAPDLNHRFRSAAPRPMLHAHRLRFAHPLTGQQLDIHAKLPDDMRTLLERQIFPAFADEHPTW